MRAGAPDEVISGEAELSAQVWSWLGTRLLTPDPIPLLSGRVTADVTAAVPERVRLLVPRRANGFDWYPGDDPEHPLARFGQELQVTVTLSVATPVDGVASWPTRVGRFLIVEWDETEDGSISVTAAGRSRRVSEAQLSAPTQPLPGATLLSEARRLSPLPVSFHPALVDRPCPSGMSWSGSRLEALQEIADAWPARLRTDEWGQLFFAPVLPDVPSPVLTLRQGERGTVVHALRSDTREGAYNEVVATSSAVGAEGVFAVERVGEGPMDAAGPYGVVTKRWASPLIGTRAQAQAAARTILARSTLPSRRLPVTCAPDPRIDFDDPVQVLHGDLERRVTRAAGPVLARNEARNPGPLRSAVVSTAVVRRNVVLDPAGTNTVASDTWQTSLAANAAKSVGPALGPFPTSARYTRVTTSAVAVGPRISVSAGTECTLRLIVRASETLTNVQVQHRPFGSSATTAVWATGVTIPAGVSELVVTGTTHATAPNTGNMVALIYSTGSVGSTLDAVASLVAGPTPAEALFSGDVTPDPLLVPAWTGAVAGSPSTLTGSRPAAWATASDRLYLVGDGEGGTAIEVGRDSGQAYIDPTGVGAGTYHSPPAESWVALGIDVMPLTAADASTMRTQIPGYSGATFAGGDGQGVFHAATVGQWSRAVHVRQIAAMPAGAYVRLLVWPTSSSLSRFRVRRAVVVFASTEAHAREVAATFFDGSGRSGRWTGAAGNSPSELLGPADIRETYEPSERTWGYVVAYDLPLTVDDGPMRVDLGVTT